MKKQVLFTILMLLPFIAMADDSGKCGDNLTWTYVEATKTLTISGTGEMANYYIDQVPWYSYREKILKVSIGGNVISIGKYAFSGCTGLISVDIPSSVTSVGSYAFEDCTGLISVTIPNSVTSIGYRAFEGCI